DTQHPPNISTPAWPASSDESGLILMIDLDAPYEDRRVSALHWLVKGLTISSPSASTSNPSSLTIPSTAQVSWQPPNPPIGDIAHTYAFYLIAPVPADLDISAEPSQSRTPFDLKQWLEERGLEKNVVARNHFRIRNLKGTPTAIFPGPR
ncbi:phosphatidylethanolamine-binding protein, partial [Phaeosphaeria sp. MPI-PUGE-AT-0046c]